MKAVVTRKSKTVSIISEPWCRDFTILRKVKAGDVIDVNEEYAYGWNDRLYVKVSNNGWIVASALIYLDKEIFITSDGLALHTRDNRLFLLKKR